MPTYTVRKVDSDDKHEWDVRCSWKELEEMCEEYGLEKVIKPIKIISSRQGSTMRKAGSEWENKLSQIHKNAGRRSKIKV